MAQNKGWTFSDCRLTISKQEAPRCKHLSVFWIRIRIMVFNNNISFISWRTVLLVEETGENHRPALQVTDKLHPQCCIEYTLPWAGFKLCILLIVHLHISFVIFFLYFGGFLVKILICMWYLWINTKNEQLCFDGKGIKWDQIHKIL